MFDSLIAWLAARLQEFLTWVYDLVLWVPKKLFSLIMDALASFFESIPVPGFITNAGSFFQGIPDSFLYFINMFAVGEGIAMVIAAYILRFILRRIPFIG